MILKCKNVINFCGFIFFLSACQNTDREVKQITKKDSLQAKKILVKDTIPSFDTTIILHKTPRSTPIKNNVKLTAEAARDFVYAHYKKQGVNNEFEKVDTSQDAICVRWDTAYLVDINHDSFTDAVVSYWVFPCFGSSHYNQPHKAMLISSSGKYFFMNEDFLPSNFSIDSIGIERNGNTVIYGDVEDLVLFKVTRKFRASLINK